MTKKLKETKTAKETPQQEQEVYELQVGTYEDATGENSNILVLVEFEVDPESGLVANYYLTSEDADREFFDHVLYRCKDAPDMEENKWKERCLRRVDDDLSAGLFSIETVTSWIEKKKQRQADPANRQDALQNPENTVG